MVTSIWRKTALVLPALMLMAGCGGDDDDNAAAQSDESEESSGDGLVIDGEVVADAELYAAAQEEGELLLYTSYLEEAAASFGGAFTEETGIEVEVIRLPTGRLMERALSEAGADQLGADIIQVSEPAAAEELVAEDLAVCEPLDPAITETMLESYVDPDGCYYAATFSAMSIGYNSQLVNEGETPETWEDLLDERWSGQMGITFAGVGGSAYSVWHMLREEYGVEYWEAFAAQDPQILNSNSTISEELQRGELTAAFMSPSVAIQAQDRGAPIEFVFPTDAVAPYPNFTLQINPEQGGSNPNAATVFRNWTFSKAGQAEYAYGAWAGRLDVPPPPAFPETDEINLIAAPIDEWLSAQDDNVAEWNTVFGYVPE